MVPSYINACDILVAPYNILNSSRRNKGIGSPLKVLEYMACGKPAIGSDLPQVADIIESGKTGLLFQQGNPVALAMSIMSLAENPSYRRQLGDRAINAIEKQYSWSTLAEQIASVLEKAIVSHG
jgi:glycosyltransferase involved in cell wall biosynthesis